MLKILPGRLSELGDCGELEYYRAQIKPIILGYYELPYEPYISPISVSDLASL